MENQRNRIRGLNDILRDQLNLLAEQSELEGDGAKLAVISHEMINIYQALTSSESKGQKEGSEPNVEMVTEVVMDVVKRIEEVRTEKALHTDSQNEGSNNGYLIDISQIVKETIERQQANQERSHTMDINKLLIEAGAWGQNPNNEQITDEFAELLYEEFQKMTLQKFKQYFRRKVNFEKEKQEFVIEFAFK